MATKEPLLWNGRPEPPQHLCLRPASTHLCGPEWPGGDRELFYETAQSEATSAMKESSLALFGKHGGGGNRILFRSGLKGYQMQDYFAPRKKETQA